MRGILATVLGASLLACGSSGQDEKKEDQKPNKATVVPFELLKSGHMAVMVKVNGKGPFRLIFDTGAPISLVNTKLARSAGLTKGGPKMGGGDDLFGGLGALLSAGEVKIKTLEVGDAKAEDVPAIVMEHPTVAALSSALKKEVYGLVGFPFFARFQMTIDYKDKTLTLQPSTYRPPDVMKAMNATMMSVLRGKQTPKMLSSAGQWGLMADKKLDDEDDGVDVRTVMPGGPADKAGLKVGDRLLTIDGRWTDSLEDLYDAAGYARAGTNVPVRVKRDGKEMELTVVPKKGL